MARQQPLYVVYPATALAGPVYRIVPQCPPAEADFLSHEAVGREYDRREAAIQCLDHGL